MLTRSKPSNNSLSHSKFPNDCLSDGDGPNTEEDEESESCDSQSEHALDAVKGCDEPSDQDGQSEHALDAVKGCDEPSDQDGQSEHALDAVKGCDEPSDQDGQSEHALDAVKGCDEPNDQDGQSEHALDAVKGCDEPSDQDGTPDEPQQKIQEKSESDNPGWTLVENEEEVSEVSPLKVVDSCKKPEKMDADDEMNLLAGYKKTISAVGKTAEGLPKEVVSLGNVKGSQAPDKTLLCSGPSEVENVQEQSKGCSTEDPETVPDPERPVLDDKDLLDAPVSQQSLEPTGVCDTVNNKKPAACTQENDDLTGNASCQVVSSSSNSSGTSTTPVEQSRDHESQSSSMTPITIGIKSKAKLLHIIASGRATLSDEEMVNKIMNNIGVPVDSPEKQPLDASVVQKVSLPAGGAAPVAMETAGSMSFPVSGSTSKGTSARDSNPATVTSTDDKAKLQKYVKKVSSRFIGYLFSQTSTCRTNLFETSLTDYRSYRWSKHR